MDWYLDAGDPHAVRELRHAFVDHLRLHAEPDSDIAAAELAFAEILANVHRHALGPAWVRLDWGDERSVLTVYDSGHTFEPDIKLPDDPFSPGGRGLFVAEQLTGEVRVAGVEVPVHALVLLCRTSMLAGRRCVRVSRIRRRPNPPPTSR